MSAFAAEMLILSVYDCLFINTKPIKRYVILYKNCKLKLTFSRCKLSLNVLRIAKMEQAVILLLDRLQFIC